jgi:hypothetical protein
VAVIVSLTNARRKLASAVLTAVTVLLPTNLTLDAVDDEVEIAAVEPIKVPATDIAVRPDSAPSQANEPTGSVKVMLFML